MLNWQVINRIKEENCQGYTHIFLPLPEIWMLQLQRVVVPLHLTPQPPRPLSTVPSPTHGNPHAHLDQCLQNKFGLVLLLVRAYPVANPTRGLGMFSNQGEVSAFQKEQNNQRGKEEKQHRELLED
jgi:hypothetical protein